MKFETVCRTVSRLLAAAALIGLLFMAAATTQPAHAQQRNVVYEEWELQSIRLHVDVVRANANWIANAWSRKQDPMGAAAARLARVASQSGVCRPKRQQKLHTALNELIVQTGLTHDFNTDSEEYMVASFTSAARAAVYQLTGAICHR